MSLISSNEYGFHPQAIEAMAFGWMARQRFCKKNPIQLDPRKPIIKPKNNANTPSGVMNLIKFVCIIAN